MRSSGEFDPSALLLYKKRLNAAVMLLSERSWAIFHVVGANPKMKSAYSLIGIHGAGPLIIALPHTAMYQWYQIMICLLKFDFFFFTGVTIQVCHRLNVIFIWYFDAQWTY